MPDDKWIGGCGAGGAGGGATGVPIGPTPAPFDSTSATRARVIAPSRLVSSEIPDGAAVGASSIGRVVVAGGPGAGAVGSVRGGFGNSMSTRRTARGTSSTYAIALRGVGHSVIGRHMSAVIAANTTTA